MAVPRRSVRWILPPQNDPRSSKPRHFGPCAVANIEAKVHKVPKKTTHSTDGDSATPTAMILEVSLDNSPGLQLEKTPQLRAPFGREVADGAQGGGAIRRLKQSIQDGGFLALPATLSLDGTQAESSDLAEGSVHRGEVLPTSSPEAGQ